jgi:hypothetical protein
MKDTMSIKIGDKILSRDGKCIGNITSLGDSHRCTMDGCRGKRVSVKWRDGRTTFPCTSGLRMVTKRSFIIM